MTADPPLVAIFVPPDARDRERWLAECMLECQRRRLHVLTITYDPRTAAKLLINGEVDRVVCARPDHKWLLQPEPVDVVCDPPDRPRNPGRPQRLDRRTARRRPYWRTD